MRTRTALPLLIAITALPILPASAAITHLAAADRAALMQDKFDVVHTTSAIPKCVRDEFAKQTGATTFWMADPTEQFQSSDNASGNLPFYRLAFGASNKDYYVIEALRGGASPGSEIFLFKLTPAKPADIPFVIHQVHGAVPHSQGAIVIDDSPASAKLVWIADEDQTAGSLDAVRKAVSADKMNDSNVDLVGNRTARPSNPGIGNPIMPTATATW